MPIKERPVDRGARRGRWLRSRVAADLIAARIAHGLSQREIARMLRISHTRVRGIESGRADLSIELAAKVAAVLGLELSARVHPDGGPMHDKGHLALLERFHARLPDPLEWRTEVVMPIAGDREVPMLSSPAPISPR